MGATLEVQRPTRPATKRSGAKALDAIVDLKVDGDDSGCSGGRVRTMGPSVLRRGVVRAGYVAMCVATRRADCGLMMSGRTVV